MRVSFVPLLLAALLGGAGCSSSPRPPPLAPEPEAPAANPVLVEDLGEAPAADLPGNPAVPRSIRRLILEQREEVARISALAERLADRSGRARAMREAAELSRELSLVESVLATSPDSDSEAFDDAVLRLQRLATKTALIHDALRTAAL